MMQSQLATRNSQLPAPTVTRFELQCFRVGGKHFCPVTIDVTIDASAAPGLDPAEFLVRIERTLEMFATPAWKRTPHMRRFALDQRPCVCPFCCEDVIKSGAAQPGELCEIHRIAEAAESAKSAENPEGL